MVVQSILDNGNVKDVDVWDINVKNSCGVDCCNGGVMGRSYGCGVKKFFKKI